MKKITLSPKKRLALTPDERAFRFFYDLLRDIIINRYYGNTDELIFEYNIIAFYIGKKRKCFENRITRTIISRWCDTDKIKHADIPQDDLNNISVVIGVLDELTPHNRYTAEEMGNKLYEYVKTKPSDISVYGFVKYLNNKWREEAGI